MISELEIISQAAAFFSLVNVVLLCGLIAVYGNSLRKIRAEFTFGLLFFATLFLLQNIIALYSYVTMFMYYSSDVRTRLGNNRHADCRPSNPLVDESSIIQLATKTDILKLNLEECKETS